MSLEVLLQKFPEDAARPEQVPDDHLPPAVGSRAEVAAAVRKLFRNTEYLSESFITVERSSFTLEISLGDEDPCSQLLVQVHGDATKAILRLADHFGMRAIDCSTSEFIAATGSGGKRGVGEKKRKEEARHPMPRPAWPLSGLARGPCDRYVYLSFLSGESPKRLQNTVFRRWMELAKEHGELAGISGPMFVLTLPDGETFGDFWVRRYPALVTEKEADFIPMVQMGAALVHAFAATTGRRSGEIESGSVFVCDGGQRIPLAECAHRQLWTDADYGQKVKGKRKG